MLVCSLSVTSQRSICLRMSGRRKTTFKIKADKTYLQCATKKYKEARWELFNDPTLTKKEFRALKQLAGMPLEECYAKLARVHQNMRPSLKKKFRNKKHKLRALITGYIEATTFRQGVSLKLYIAKMMNKDLYHKKIHKWK